MKPKPDFSIDDLLAEFDFMSRNAEGLSAEEISEAKELSPKAVNKRLRKLWKAGKIEVGFRKSTNMVGVGCRIPVYKLKGGEKDGVASS